LPEKFALLQNYPNPFNPETWIPFQLPKASSVKITIYAQDGKLVRTLALGEKEAGFYIDKESSAYWDGRNDAGEKVGSGVYFYQLLSGDFRKTMKMVLSK
jgi:flagellar hook assembly protein FlgD